MNATHALGWALVHFVWQGAALAGLLALSLAFTRPAAARTRYALAMLTLVAMLLVPIATGFRLYRRSAASLVAPSPSAVSPTGSASPSPSSAVIVAAAPPAPAPSASPDAWMPQLRPFIDPALPWVIGLWVAGVVVLSVRLAHGFVSARRLRIAGTRTVAASLQAVLDRLAARLRVARPVALLESILVEVPAVIGWLRPVVLVPTSALTGLTPQQLEVLLAHELAHVRRHDYLVNVVQCAIETLLFYHPAVWWVSRRVREEREHCCDDAAVELCGDAQLYASALVDMERMRRPTPRLALAATGGGSLLHRIRRLLFPAADRLEVLPGWTAGIAGVVAVTIALLATGTDRVVAEPSRGEKPVASDTTRMAPDTVVRHPDPSVPLAQRWEWAHARARALGRRTYWVGYRIAGPDWLEHSVYIDRLTAVTGPNVTLSGRLRGDFQGLIFRGVRLAPLVGGEDSDDIALLLGFANQTGRPALIHVHVASFDLPADFRGRTLVWLGSAPDAQSLPLLDELFAATPQAELREDLVSAVGVHGSSGAVVGMLQRWLTSREPDDVRSQAAEWLGFHPTAAAVNALSRAARTDQSGDVRREAAESLGDNTLPAATDSTIAIARTATDPDVRREAVEGLGQKDSERALAALVSIAQADRDEDVQREAVEALGEIPGGNGLPAVREIARRHSSTDVRREAVETLGEHLPAAEAVPMLETIATTDPSSDVQRQAIETLAETAPTAETARFLADLAKNARNEDAQREAVEQLGEIGELGLPAVIDIARTHASSDIRRTAVETIGEYAAPVQALDLLAQFARSDRDADVQRRAVESLGDLHDARALSLLVGFARSHPVTDVRRQAIETYGETASADSAVALCKQILNGDAPEDIYNKVLETLEELDGGAGIPALLDAARSHPNREVRADALRRLAESDDARAKELFERTLRRP